MRHLTDYITLDFKKDINLLITGLFFANHQHTLHRHKPFSLLANTTLLHYRISWLCQLSF